MNTVSAIFRCAKDTRRESRLCISALRAHRNKADPALQPPATGLKNGPVSLSGCICCFAVQAALRPKTFAGGTCRTAERKTAGLPTFVVVRQTVSHQQK